MKPLPSQAEIQASFSYDLINGGLRWKVNRRRDLIGTVAGTPGPYGHMSIKYKQVSYRAHRLVWMYVYGEDPGEYELDHINHDPTDNRIENLRMVTHKENHQNRKVKHDKRKYHREWKARWRRDNYDEYITKRRTREGRTHLL